MSLLNNVNDAGHNSKVLEIQLLERPSQQVPFGQSVRFYRWYFNHFPGQHFPLPVCRRRSWHRDTKTLAVLRLLPHSQRRGPQRLGPPHICRFYLRGRTYVVQVVCLSCISMWFQRQRRVSRLLRVLDLPRWWAGGKARRRHDIWCQRAARRQSHTRTDVTADVPNDRLPLQD